MPIIVKPIKEEIDGMLYQKTYEDFNKEKPNPADPIQMKANPMQIEKNTTIQKK